MMAASRNTDSILALFMVLALSVSADGAVANDKLAEVDGEVITTEQVEKPIGASLAKLQEQIYNLKRQRLEAMITDRLLAKAAAKRGISVPALLDAEVTSKVG
ncbi:MAG: SurA N-terminal domain-containing protein, partial [Candidatus Binatia bacterium]